MVGIIVHIHPVGSPYDVLKTTFDPFILCQLRPDFFFRDTTGPCGGNSGQRIFHIIQAGRRQQQVLVKAVRCARIKTAHPLPNAQRLHLEIGPGVLQSIGIYPTLRMETGAQFRLGDQTPARFYLL